MKALATLTAYLIVQLACAQAIASLTLPAEVRTTTPDATVQRDLVGADLQLTTDLTEALVRERRATRQGWEVRVIAADGTLRMTGTYKDEELTIPHGLFAYHHPDGNLESAGRYVSGLKKGVWQRYAPDGTPLAERVYGAGSYKDLELQLGWATVAEVVPR
ncbi:MAG: hypothetical protein R2810_08940 [Flavobacteriales bacterium]